MLLQNGVRAARSHGSLLARYHYQVQRRLLRTICRRPPFPPSPPSGQRLCSPQWLRLSVVRRGISTASEDNSATPETILLPASDYHGDANDTSLTGSKSSDLKNTPKLAETTPDHTPLTVKPVSSRKMSTVPRTKLKTKEARRARKEKRKRDSKLRRAEQKAAKAAEGEQKENKKSQQQADGEQEQLGKPPTDRASPEASSPELLSTRKNTRCLAAVFTMAKRMLRRQTNSMPSKLTLYDGLIHAPLGPSSSMIEAHLARARQALGFMRVICGLGDTPWKPREGSPAEQLDETLAEIKRRIQAVQKQAASRPLPQRVPEELNNLLATTSVLLSILQPPKSEKIRAGSAKSVGEDIDANHRVLVAQLSAVYPQLGIKLDESFIRVPKSEASASDPCPSESAGPRLKDCQVRPIIIGGIETDREHGNKTFDKKSKRASKGEFKERTRRRRSTTAHHSSSLEGREGVEVINSGSLFLAPIEVPRPPIPKLTYGLDRVLFNPGVYQLKDLRTGVYNFDPYLANLMPVTEFDYASLQSYITSSKDTTLIDLAESQGKKYTGSTSSMTSVLAHFHYLISGWRPLNPGNTTRAFRPESVNFTRVLRCPAAVFLHYNNGTYAIDADKEYDRATVLSMLGQSMEKLFTSTKEEFERYRKSRSHELTQEEKNERNAYHYTAMGDFLMRSQLDAKDDRLPGTGVFDLKTRAVISIRMDASDIRKALGYEINQRFGNWESYEREYYDLVRSAFLKYSLQVRMGRMDGIFVAYHNTQNVFGFQYFPLGEMDFAIHGTDQTDLGDREFKLSIHLLNKILDRATKRFQGRSLRMHFETRPSEVQPFMYVFARPVTQNEIQEIQTANQKSVAEFERNILGLFRGDEADVATTEDEEPAGTDGRGPVVEEGEHVIVEEDGVSEENAPMLWEELRSRVNEAIEENELGVDTIRDAVEDALEESGLMPTNCGEADSKLYVDTLMEILGQSTFSESEESSGTASAHDDEIGLIECITEEDSNYGTTEKILVDETLSAEAEESGQVSSYKDSVTGAANETVPSLVETPDSEAGLDIGKAAVDADIRASSVPHAQARVAALKALLLLRQQQQQEQRGEEEPKSEDGEIFAQIREFERVFSEAMADHLGRDDHLHRLPHPSVTITPAEEQVKELVGYSVVIRNRVDEKIVPRPIHLTPDTRWELEYVVTEMPEATAQRLYGMMLERRKKELEHEDKDAEWYRMFQGQLHRYSSKGRKVRAERFRKEFGRDVHVYGEDKPRKWHEAFESSHVEEQMRIMGIQPGSEEDIEERGD